MKTALIAFVLALGTTAPALAQSFLETSGDWRARGMFREKIDAPLIRGQCRFAATVEGATTSVKGKCGAAVGTAAMNLAITRAGGNAVKAAISSTAFDEIVSYEGTEFPEGLRMRATEPSDFEGTQATFEMELVWKGEGFVLQQFAHPADGSDRVLIVQMDFKQQ